MSIVVGEEGMSLYLGLIVGGIELFQLLSLAFREEFIEIWKEEPWQATLRHLLSLTTLLGVPNESSILYLGGSLLLLVVLLMILVSE
jgi:hypothetical protein